MKTSLFFAVPAFFTAALALAANPHFVGQTKATLQGGNLVVSFKEAGLGDNTLIDYEARADATAVYACINGGGNHPQAANKEEVAGPVVAEGTFSSGKNGNITASLTILPPASTLDCPPGQREVLAAVSYTGIRIVDLTNGVQDAARPSSLSAVFFDI